MSKYDLLKETFLGNLGEQIPISLWKHHPEKDRTPEGLAEAEIEFHKLLDHDLLKMSFFGHFPCIDFGCTAVYDGAITGSTTLTSAAINDVSDWETLEPLDVNAGELGNQIHAVELIQEYAHGIVPTMSTVFDPAMVADKISDKNFSKYADENPEILKGALDIITDIMIEFASATIDAGADGIFLASQHSTNSSVTDEQYKSSCTHTTSSSSHDSEGRQTSSFYIYTHVRTMKKSDLTRLRRPRALMVSIGRIKVLLSH
jgi:uroporphyrinogen decarboxylase